MFHRFFNSLVRSRYLSFFSHSTPSSPRPRTIRPRRTSPARSMSPPNLKEWRSYPLLQLIPGTPASPDTAPARLTASIPSSTSIITPATTATPPKKRQRTPSTDCSKDQLPTPSPHKKSLSQIQHWRRHL